jgi:beta-lactamase regulating signal transducer with metallopeptidase domain
MNSVLNAVVNGMIVSAGLAVVVQVALWLMPARLLNAATRYAIWWAVMAAVVLLPLAYVPFGSGRIVVLTRRSGFVNAPLVPRAQVPARPIAPFRSSPQPSVVLPAARARVVQRPLFPVAITTGAWGSRVVFFWGGLAALMLLRLLVSVVMLERRKGRATAAPQVLTDKILAWLRWRRDLRVLCSSEMSLPVAAGPWRPSVLLPARLVETLGEDELAQIGIHEAGHLARRDDYALIAQRVLEALLVLHPVVWWVSRRIDLEREIACDDLVVEATGEAQPYAACLARVVELSGAVRAVPAAAAAADRSQLATRVAMLLDSSRNHATGLSKLRLVLALVCVAGISWGGVQGRRFLMFTDGPVRVVKVTQPPRILFLAQTGRGGAPASVPGAAAAGRSDGPANEKSVQATPGSDGGEDGQIAQMPEREKEIIAATFRQESDKTMDPQQAAGAATQLAMTQAKLHYLAGSLLLEFQAREMAGGTQANSEFEKDMMAAVDAMRPAAEQLQEQRWTVALGNEQKALQALLLADEASGHPGPAQQGAATVGAQDRQSMIDFAMRELDDLARRLQMSSQMNGLTPTERLAANDDELVAEQLVKQLREGLRETGAASTPLVYVPAEVRDPMGRFVTGLDRDAFHVREDGVEQNVIEVLGSDAPPNIFLVTDSRFPAGVDFSKTRGVVVPYEAMPGKVIDTVRTMSQLARTRVSGRKVAIIVAGSSENASNYTEAELRNALAGLGMPAFVFVVPDSGAGGQAGILNEIAARSGGRYVPVASADDVAAAIERVIPEAANLYYLGYAPSNAVRDGSYRNVQVTIQTPRGLPALTVLSASGYVAAQ